MHIKHLLFVERGMIHLIHSIHHAIIAFYLPSEKNPLQSVVKVMSSHPSFRLGFMWFSSKNQAKRKL